MASEHAGTRSLKHTKVAELARPEAGMQCENKLTNQLDE